MHALLYAGQQSPVPRYSVATPLAHISTKSSQHVGSHWTQELTALLEVAATEACPAVSAA